MSHTQTEHTIQHLIDEDGAHVTITESWLPQEKATELMDQLLRMIHVPPEDPGERIEGERYWEKGQIKMFSKTYPVPRLQYFCGDEGIKEYKYSRQIYPIDPWIPEVEALRNLVERITGIKFDSCLLNYYRDGNDSISLHSDKEALGPGNAVATISLGASRTFHFCSVQKDPVTNMFKHRRSRLNNGDLVLMLGDCQRLWKHEIPKENCPLPRISLTFRMISS